MGGRGPWQRLPVLRAVLSRGFQWRARVPLAWAGQAWSGAPRRYLPSRGLASRSASEFRFRVAPCAEPGHRKACRRSAAFTELAARLRRGTAACFLLQNAEPDLCVTLGGRVCIIEQS